MTNCFHIVVWIDHSDARIFELGRNDSERTGVTAENRPGHLHHKSGTVGGEGHKQIARKFLASVARELAGAREILIVGNGTAKTEFAHYLRDHEKALYERVLGVETVDHKSEGEVLAFARKFFAAKDRTTLQIQP
jgi:stalled ribosome rescue protein Dom34